MLLQSRYSGRRGGGKSGDHVDVLGNHQLLDILLSAAAGHYEEVHNCYCRRCVLPPPHLLHWAVTYISNRALSNLYQNLGRPASISPFIPNVSLQLLFKCVHPPVAIVCSNTI